MITTPPLIQARKLTRHYVRGSELVKALDGIDLEILSGQIVSVLGPSGSGKTTLINLLSCLDTPTSGELLVNGYSVVGCSEENLVEVRRGFLGFVFQQFHLLPTLSVTENIELPLLFLGKRAEPEQTAEILNLVGLFERAHHLPKELSGGQMQRVAIARALITSPRILIADEPTGNLDRGTGESIFRLFDKLVRDTGLSVIVTTHNQHLGNLANRIVLLEDGKDRF